MGFFRLSYQTADGQRVPLPDHIDGNASVEALKEFATQHGYTPEKWQGDSLRKQFFGAVHLEPANDIENPTAEINWHPFKKALIDEPSLFDYPWEVFERRIQANLLSAILDKNNNPIGTINVIAKLNEALYKELGIDKTSFAQDNPPQVYETGAGWMDKRYRGLGLYNKLRSTVLDDADAKKRLLFSQASGVGASFVNVSNGYTLVNWNDYPFAASLMGWKPSEKDIEASPDLANQFILSAGKIITPPEKGLYVGGTIFTKTPEGAPANQDFIANHPWKDHYHLWVNDLDKLNRFERNLRHGLGLNGQESPTSEVFKFALQRWRDRVANALFNDKTLLGTDPDLEKRWNEFRDPTDTAKNDNNACTGCAHHSIVALDR